MPNNEGESGEGRRYLFVLSTPSRADEVQAETLSDSLKRMLEDDYAARLGVDAERFRASESGTESTSQIGSGTQCFSSTDTSNGDDVTTDTTVDDPASTIVDDIQNDSGTGGIIDIPV